MSNPKLLSPSIMRQVLSKGMLVQPNEQFWAFDIKRKSWLVRIFSIKIEKLDIHCFEIDL